MLKQAGLVAVYPQAQRRLYQLRPEPLIELNDWLAPYRRLWEQQLDLLERHLDAMDDPGEVLEREGDNQLRFELEPDGNGCLLVFTHTFHDRPAAASYAAGWQLCLDAQEQVLAGEPVEWGRPATDLHEEFIHKFGLDAGASEVTPDGWVVRFERQFMGAPVDRVWSTLTGSGAAEENREAFAPLPGDPVPKAFTTEEIATGAITRSEAQRLLEYEWLSSGRTAGFVRWELSHGPGGARLSLTQTGPKRLAGERETALSAWQARIEQLVWELQRS